MPKLELSILDHGGGIEVNHNCCDAQGNRVYNVRSLKRPKSKVYTQEEKDTLTSYQRSGAEQVHKWKSKIPVYYLGPDTIEKELRGGRYSLLGKLIDTFKQEFKSKDSKVKNSEGVREAHVGKPRAEIYSQAISYLEKHVLPTEGFEEFISTVKDLLMRQLEINSDHFELLLSPPDADYFYDQLEFHVKENDTAPSLPILRNGTGFVSLFLSLIHI